MAKYLQYYAEKYFYRISKIVLFNRIFRNLTFQNTHSPEYNNVPQI